MIFQSSAAVTASAATQEDTQIAVSGETLTYGDYEYEVNDNNTITLTKYIQSSTEFTVPSEIDGKPVTKIGQNAFAKTNVRTIALPDSVTTIDSGAFSKCKSLSEVTLPKELTTLGREAFGYCTSLKEVTIPKTLTIASEYGAGAFRYSGLQKATFEDGTTATPSYIFSYCDKLREIVIPMSATTIGKGLREKSDRAVIYCYKDSAAHIYAEENEYPYVLLDGDTSKIFYEENLDKTEPEPDSDKEETDLDETDTDITSDTEPDTDESSDVISDTETDTDESSDVTSDTEPNTDESSDVTSDTESDTDESSDVTSDTEPDTDESSDVISDTETDTDESSDVTSDTEPNTDESSDVTSDTEPSKPDDKKPIGNLGDLDGDKLITANDALVILRASIGLEKFTQDQITLADIDGDKLVTANDALIILRASVGMKDKDTIDEPVMS